MPRSLTRLGRGRGASAAGDRGLDRAVRWAAWVLPLVLVIVAGALVSAASFAALRRGERRETARRAADMAQEQIERLQLSIQRSLEVFGYCDDVTVLRRGRRALSRGGDGGLRRLGEGARLRV